MGLCSFWADEKVERLGDGGEDPAHRAQPAATAHSRPHPKWIASALTAVERAETEHERRREAQLEGGEAAGGAGGAGGAGTTRPSTSPSTPHPCAQGCAQGYHRMHMMRTTPPPPQMGQ